MDITFDNVWARVTRATEEELDWLDVYTSCDRKVHRRSVNYSPDERYHMFRRTGMLLPSGFVPLLPRAAKRDAIKLHLIDRRTRPFKPELDSSLIPWIRDYQRDAVWAVLQGGGRGLVKVPTAGGKTEIAIALSRIVPCEWLFVVHRSDLVVQAGRRFALRTGESPGYWTRGRWERGSSNFTASTFQALARARKKRAKGITEFLEAIQGVNVDEVHAQPADTFYATTLFLPNAYYRVGQSGTPLDRADWENLRTIGALGPVLYEIPRQELVDRRLLSESRIRMLPFRHPETLPVAEWHEVYEQLIVHNAERNELLTGMAEAAAKPCLFFVEELEHEAKLAHMLRQSGLRVDEVNRHFNVTQRQQKLQNLLAGGLDVLMCTVVFQEGIDAPALKSVVVGGGKSSIVATLQRIGRGMRTDAETEKYAFEVWDVLDKGHPWLASHARTRLEAYEQDGHTVEIGWGSM